MTEDTARRVSSRQDIACYVLGLLVVALLILQSMSLFEFPQPNSIRWFGDETWLMQEARSQITTGVVRYPLAESSALEHSKGLVLSLTWLSSILYGLPSAIIHASPVAVGRFVTLMLSLALCAALYLCSYRLGASKLSAVIAVALLVSSRSFFFTSHSGRPDILAGLLVLLFVSFCVDESRKPRTRTLRWLFFYGGIVGLLCVTSSIHLLTLIGPVAVYFLFVLSGERPLKSFANAAAGFATSICLLILVYYFTAGDLHLFAQSGSKNQFHDVLSSIPILRPFSRSVQVSNLLIRLREFASESPQLILLPVIALVSLMCRRAISDKPTRALFSAVLIVFLCWLMLEGTEINYLMHIVPLLWLLFAILLTRLAREKWRHAEFAVACIAAISVAFGVNDALRTKENAHRLAASNSNACEEILRSVRNDWKGVRKAKVLSETPTLEQLSESDSIHVVTDHLISFPLTSDPLDSVLRRANLNYVVLYNSPVYPKNRYRDDPFYQAVRRDATPIDSVIGTIGDMGRDYFHPSDFRDTVFLFRLNAR